MAMGTRQMLLFLFLIILSHLANITTAQLPDFIEHFCTNSANYTTNSAYQSNLDTVLSSLPSNTGNNYGFYNRSAGQDPDTVYPAALCRGDISEDICRDCVSNAIHKLRELCPNQKEAIGWYDYCMLRFSNDRVFHRVDPNFYTVYHWSENSVTSAELPEFNRQLTSLTERLQSEAAAGGPLRKFDTGNIGGPNFRTIYGLMQCNPDLSETECSTCLNNIRMLIPECCLNEDRRRQGGRVLRPNCNLRYEIDKFYADIPAISLPQTSGNNTTRTIIIIVVSVISVILAAAILIWIYNFIRKQTTMEIPNAPPTNSFPPAATEYDLKEIRHATDNFSKKLGEGAFGAVYEGTLENGRKIAVKKPKSDRTRADGDLRNEVSVLAKLQHKNLVSLVGFCRDGTRILLIYEFVANKTLAEYIFESNPLAGVEGNRAKSEIFDWDKLYKIIEGVARGLLYLHVDSQLQIIHRDLKPSNILLDKDMNPKIADFGTARLLMLEATHSNTNQPIGTRGYMAPEYAFGQYSVKTDVYSFGIILLEILTGKKNNPEGTLLSYVWRNWQAESISVIINSALSCTDPSSLQCIIRCIHIGLLCIQENAIRPTMDLVSQWLQNQSITLEEPKMPALLEFINPQGSSVMKIHDSNQSSQAGNESTHTSLAWEFDEAPMLLT